MAPLQASLLSWSSCFLSTANRPAGRVRRGVERHRTKSKQLITCLEMPGLLAAFGTRCSQRSAMGPVNIEEEVPARERRVYRPAAERREEIITAAQAAFVRSTFAGARTRDIAEAAGVNQATLFKLFPTKERLFEEAVLNPLIELLRNIHGKVEVYETAQPPAE